MSRMVRELVICGGLIFVAGMVYWESLSLPEGLYDPLGAGTMPRIIAGGIVLLSLAVAARAVLTRAAEAPVKQPGDVDPGEAVEAPLRPTLGLGVYLCAVAFATLLAFRAPYWAISATFLFVAALAVMRFRRSSILPALIFAVAASGIITYLFGSVFRVDLP